MSQLLSLLAAYYLCDQAAALRALNAAEVSACMAHYERIKQEFLDEPPARVGTPERVAQNRLGYAGFKAWEAANPDIVRELRAYAQLRLQRG